MPREGEKLFLKGEKCFTDKCAIERRSYAPGQHGQNLVSVCLAMVSNCVKSRRSVVSTASSNASSAGLTLKLIAARVRPVKTCCNCWKVVSTPSLTAWVLVLRALKLARWFATMGVLVNGKRVNIPSYALRPGDVVALNEASRGHLRVKAALEAAEQRGSRNGLKSMPRKAPARSRHIRNALNCRLRSTKASWSNCTRVNVRRA